MNNYGIPIDSSELGNIPQPQLGYRFYLKTSLSDTTDSILRHSLKNVLIQKKPSTPYQIILCFRENIEGSVLSAIDSFSSLLSFSIIAYNGEKINYATNITNCCNIEYVLDYDYSNGGILDIKVSMDAHSVFNIVEE